MSSNFVVVGNFQEIVVVQDAILPLTPLVAVTQCSRTRKSVPIIISCQVSILACGK